MILYFMDISRFLTFPHLSGGAKSMGFILGLWGDVSRTKASASSGNHLASEKYIAIWAGSCQVVTIDYEK
jgi:hypothetical protein